jgi:hypothetical protein
MATGAIRAASFFDITRPIPPLGHAAICGIFVSIPWAVEPSFRQLVAEKAELQLFHCEINRLKKSF